MKIRKATLEDTDKIFSLAKSEKNFKVSEEAPYFWPKHILKICLESNNPIFVAEEGNNILGFIITNYNPSFSKAIIENIYVDPEYRGKNIGEELLKKLIEELKSIKCEYVCCQTEKDNSNALDFFIKNGFNRGIDCVWLDKIL